MAFKVILPAAFVRHTDGQKQLTSNASDLPGLVAEIDASFPALATQIKDENGKIRRFINIYVNDEDIRFLGGEAYAFQDGDEVMLIPSIAGGASCGGELGAVLPPVGAGVCGSQRERCAAMERREVTAPGRAGQSDGAKL